MSFHKNLFKLNFIYFSLNSVLYPQTFGAEYKIKNLKINISADEKWQVAQNLYNSDLTFLGPEIDKRRPVIGLTVTTLENHKFDKSKLKKTSGEYYEGRQNWVKKNKGKVLEFFPYKSLKWKHVGDVHSIGYKYNLLGETFIEQTYFLNCGKKAINYTTLLTAKHNKKYAKDVVGIMGSTRCR